MASFSGSAGLHDRPWPGWAGLTPASVLRGRASSGQAGLLGTACFSSASSLIVGQAGSSAGRARRPRGQAQSGVTSLLPDALSKEVHPDSRGSSDSASPGRSCRSQREGWAFGGGVGGRAWGAWAGRPSAEAPRRGCQMCLAGQGRYLAGLGLSSLYPPVCFTKFSFFAINSRLIKLFFKTWNGRRQAASHVRWVYEQANCKFIIKGIWQESKRTGFHRRFGWVNYRFVPCHDGRAFDIWSGEGWEFAGKMQWNVRANTDFVSRGPPARHLRGVQRCFVPAFCNVQKPFHEAQREVPRQPFWGGAGCWGCSRWTRWPWPRTHKTSLPMSGPVTTRNSPWALCFQSLAPGWLSHCCVHAQSCLTLWDPLGYSPPGSSVHGILQARITTLGCLWRCRQILYQLSHWRSPVPLLGESQVQGWGTPGSGSFWSLQATRSHLGLTHPWDLLHLELLTLLVLLAGTLWNILEYSSQSLPASSPTPGEVSGVSGCKCGMYSCGRTCSSPEGGSGPSRAAHRQVTCRLCCMNCLFSRVRLCAHMDCSPPGSSAHGIKNTGVGNHALLQGISPSRDHTFISYVSCIGRWVLNYYFHL